MLVDKLTDYKTLLDTYSRPQNPETYNFNEVIAQHAADPTREALVWSNEAGEMRRFTFAQVQDETCRIADVLRQRGVKRGDRVLVMLPRVPEWQFTILAVKRLGAIAIPCITMLQFKDLGYRIELTEPAAVVATRGDTAKFDGLLNRNEARLSLAYGDGDMADGWEDLYTVTKSASKDVPIEPMRAEEGSILYFTSGSTGMPKAVEHSAHMAFGFIEVAAYWFDLNDMSQDDTIWCTADTGWSLCATGVLIGPWLTGTRVFFHDGPFDAAKRLELIAQHGITIFLAAATEYRHLLTQDIEAHDLSSLRLSATAGESLDAPTLNGWMSRAGCRLHEAYGQTESFMTIANFPGTEIRPGSMGLPFPGIPIDVINPDTHELQTVGKAGLLAIRMPTTNLMLGYYKTPEKTEACFVENAQGERWFLTGDQARRDEEGYFWYEGRNDDVINSAGYRIGPVEVEAVMMDHPAIKECAAVASPDPERGVVVKVFATLNDGATGTDALVDELKSFVKARTAPYKYPRKIEFVDALPMTPTGKIKRNVLREQEFKRQTA